MVHELQCKLGKEQQTLHCNRGWQAKFPTEQVHTHWLEKHWCNTSKPIYHSKATVPNFGLIYGSMCSSYKRIKWCVSQMCVGI